MIIYSSNYPDVMTTDDLCSMLNINKSHALKLLRSGQIKGFKINQSKQWRIAKPAIKLYVENTYKNNYNY